MTVISVLVAFYCSPTQFADKQQTILNVNSWPELDFRFEVVFLKIQEVKVCDLKPI